MFDATANLQVYRNAARTTIARFAEIFVACPLEVCEARDSKGLYRRAGEERTSTLPGVGARYERPEQPDLVVQGDAEWPDQAARQIVALLQDRGWL